LIPYTANSHSKTGNFDFDHPPQRRGSDSLKWGTYDHETLPMWVADMDFISPPAVVQALQERVTHGVFGYPLGLDGDPKQNPELRQVIIDRLKRLYQWQVQAEDLVFIPGVVDGFNLACHMVASPGGGVLEQTPIYHPILHAPENASLQRQEAPLIPTPELHYEIDWDCFEAAITGQTRLFILCNPHNPVGRVFSRDELARMAEICLSHNVLICSDEIHCDLIYPGSHHVPIASLDPQIARHAITLMAPSKTFNIPGLKFAFAVIQDADLRQKYRKASRGLVGWVNLLGQTAALAAYRDSQQWLDDLLAYLQGNRDFLCEYLDKNLPQLHTNCPEGTYLAWIDCRTAGIEGSPYDFFLSKARVAFNDGKIFGTGGEGFVRLNYACSRSTLIEALQRMKHALSG
jgi:cystathionine beta-lyase